jgi:hypothetical protein
MAAGPAGELKYRSLAGLPRAVIGGSDSQSLDRTSRLVWNTCGRDGIGSCGGCARGRNELRPALAEPNPMVKSWQPSRQECALIGWARRLDQTVLLSRVGIDRRIGNPIIVWIPLAMDRDATSKYGAVTHENAGVLCKNAAIARRKFVRQELPFCADITLIY